MSLIFLIFLSEKETQQQYHVQRKKEEDECNV